jgi:hypothetical protein
MYIALTRGVGVPGTGWFVGVGRHGRWRWFGEVLHDYCWCCPFAPCDPLLDYVHPCRQTLQSWHFR